jgi:Asp-tRNA(Asn)/Glu-tRNA(Gln) amidotransferase C subunit
MTDKYRPHSRPHPPAPERFRHPYYNGLRRFSIARQMKYVENKEEALDYLGGLRHYLRKTLKRLKRREERLNFIIEKSNSIIDQVKNMETFDKENLKSLLKEARKEYKDLREKDHPRRDKKICSNCGAIISRGAEYCSQCGQKIES